MMSVILALNGRNNIKINKVSIKYLIVNLFFPTSVFGVGISF